MPYEDPFAIEIRPWIADVVYAPAAEGLLPSRDCFPTLTLRDGSAAPALELALEGICEEEFVQRVTGFLLKQPYSYFYQPHYRLILPQRHTHEARAFFNLPFDVPCALRRAEKNAIMLALAQRAGEEAQASANRPHSVRTLQIAVGDAIKEHAGFVFQNVRSMTTHEARDASRALNLLYRVQEILRDFGKPVEDRRLSDD